MENNARRGKRRREFLAVSNVIALIVIMVFVVVIIVIVDVVFRIHPVHLRQALVTTLSVMMTTIFAICGVDGELENDRF